MPKLRFINKGITELIIWIHVMILLVLVLLIW
jgi:hypothetical protein